MRGTFGNIRLRNAMAGGKEGNWTIHLPSGDETSIYDAAMRYQAEGVPLIILAGKEYGTGSSRDWAAKGTLLLGVKAVIAQSFERIHRGNLVGMGVLPLQFLAGENAESARIDRPRGLLDRRSHRDRTASDVDGRLHPRGRELRQLPGIGPHRRSDRAQLPPQRRRPADRAAPPERLVATMDQLVPRSRGTRAAGRRPRRTPAAGGAVSPDTADSTDYLPVQIGGASRGTPRTPPAHRRSRQLAAMTPPGVVVGVRQPRFQVVVERSLAGREHERARGGDLASPARVSGSRAGRRERPR